MQYAFPYEDRHARAERVARQVAAVLAVARENAMKTGQRSILLVNVPVLVGERVRDLNLRGLRRPSDFVAMVHGAVDRSSLSRISQFLIIEEVEIAPLRSGENPWRNGIYAGNVRIRVLPDST